MEANILVMCICYVCVCMLCACECRCPWKPKEDMEDMGWSDMHL